MLTVQFSCTDHAAKGPHVLINTEYGDIEIELYPDKAPKTVAAFLSFIDAGYYKKSDFYRVLKSEGMDGTNYGIIQGGTWNTEGDKGPDVPGIPHESTKQTGLSHTTGTISLARTKPGTAGTEFFICVGDQLQFDYGNENGGDREGFAAFGKVIKGMKVVREIQKQPFTGDRFDKVITITGFKRL